MTSRWIERMSTAERDVLRDAGRIGPARFDGPATLVRPWTDPSADPLCDRCRANETHRFWVELRDGNGPAWTVEVPHALGPLDARGQARDAALAQGGIAVEVVGIGHVREEAA